MAAIGIIIKAVENLRGFQLHDPNIQDHIARKKEKLSNCSTIVDGLNLSSVKTSSKFSHTLELSIEALLSLCDDPDSDIRTVADESLNKIIKAMNDGSIRKVQIHLYREIKRNGNPRSLKAAIWRFGLLSHMIWPIKGKAYVSNLIPCILTIIQRPEESVIGALANSLPLMLKALGPFMTDKDVQMLLKALFAQISSAEAVFRRAASSMILTTCLNCRKPQYFLHYVVKCLLDKLINSPMKDVNALSIIGVFGCLKLVLLHLNPSSDNDEALDNYLQIYELCLRYSMWQSNHNVVNAALETLNQLLQSPPDDLVAVLLSPDGMTCSRITESAKEEQKLSTSQLSLSTNEEKSCDFTLQSLEGDLSEINPKVEKWIKDSEKAFTLIKSPSKQEEPSSDIIEIKEKKQESYSNLVIGFTEGEDFEESTDEVYSNVEEKSDKVLDFLTLNQNCEEEESLDDGTTLSIASPHRSLVNVQKADVGTLLDADVPLKYCCRHLVSSFLLLGFPNQTIPDKVTRVSVKSLALVSVGHILDLYPDIFFECLAKHSKEESQQMISDILLFASHSDPQIRGHLSIVIGSLLKALLVKNRESFENLETKINGIMLLQLIVKGLKDESTLTCRQTLIALNIFLRELMESSECQYAVQILRVLPQIIKNPYFLVKVKLMEVLCDLPYTVIEYVTGKSEFQENCVLSLVQLLGDRDQRVRNAASDAIVKIIPVLYYRNLNEDPVTRKASEYVDQCRFYMQPLLETSSIYHAEHKFMVNSLVEPFRSSYTMSEADKSCKINVNHALSRVVGLLIDTLTVCPSKFLTYGCCEALSRLSEAYSTTIHPNAWDCFSSPKLSMKTPKKTDGRNDATDDSPSDNAVTLSEGLLSIVLNLLSSSPMSLDLFMHRNLLQLAGNLASGLVACDFIKSNDPGNKTNSESSKTWGLLKNKRLIKHLETLLTHLIRVLNIYVHVIDEIQLTHSTVKSSLQSLTAETQALSPKRKLVSEQKSKEKNDKTLLLKSGKEKIGVFIHMPHYTKMYNILKAAHANYSVTLEPEASEMYLSLLNMCLEVLSQLLEVATMNNSIQIIEELLHYLQTTVTLASVKSVQCAQQLLKSLFGLNLTSRWEELESSKDSSKANIYADDEENDEDNKGFYNRCLQQPARDVAETVKIVGNNCRGGNEPEIGYSGTIILPTKRNERKMSLASFKSYVRFSDHKFSMESSIRLFEPMVIKSLTLYTISQNNSVPLQCQVLKLLTQLVQLHINYCLLDSENIFIDFVLKQFEFIEDGCIAQTEDLLPRIFDFLVYLSYEKYHTKMIINTPKIIQLCDGLMASGCSPETHVIPALTPVVEDIFIVRNYSSNKAENKELETTREVIISMLLRLVEFHRAIELLVICLTESKFSTEGDREEKWRCWSRLTMDAVLPALAAGKIRMEEKEVHMALVKLCGAVSPTVFRPVDPLLKVLFTELSFPSRMAELSRWLGTVNLVILALISYSKEEAMLARLYDLGTHKADLADVLLFHDSFQRPCKDPLNALSINSNDVPPEKILAKFLFRVIRLISGTILKCQKLVKSNNACTNLAHQFSLFLQLCIHMFESGSHCKIAQASMQIVKGEEDAVKEEVLSIADFNSSILRIGTSWPVITCQWTYLMTLLGHNRITFWSKLLQIPKEQSLSINQNVVKNGGLILLSDYICENNLDDDELLTWFVRNNVKEIIKSVKESPVMELTTIAVHRNANSSGLMLKAVFSEYLDLTRPSHVKNVLRCLGGAHHLQSGALLSALVPKLPTFRHLALSRMAITITSRRVEILLTLNAESAREQLPKEDFLTMMSALQSMKLEKRYESLVNLLNKLAKEHYDLPPFEFQKHRNQLDDSESMKNVAIDRQWFISQVKQRCCSRSSSMHFNGCWESAQMLSNLEFEECVDIMSSEDFDVKILRECILLGVRNTVENVQEKELKNEPGAEFAPSPLYGSSKNCLFLHLQKVNKALPESSHRLNLREKRKGEEKYVEELSLLLEDEGFWNHLFEIVPSATAYLKTLGKLSKYNLAAVDVELYEELAKFATLCLEVAQWMIHRVETGEAEAANPRELELALNCAARVLKEPEASKIFDAESRYSWVCTAAETLTRILEHFLTPYHALPVIKTSALNPAFEQEETESYGRACLQIATLVLWMEKGSSENMPSHLQNSVRSLIVSIGRKSLVNSFVLIPPLIWKSQYSVTSTGPTKCSFPLLLSSESNLLHDIEILEQFIYRVTLLGWTCRLQFEEIWMALLSVINVSQLNETSVENKSALYYENSLAVRAITRLLLDTLLLPCPGNPNNSSPIRLSRDPRLSLHKPSSQKLYKLQDLLLWKNECANSLDDFQEPKLRHLFDRENIEWNSDPREFGYGQLSVPYLWSLISSHEDKLHASVIALKSQRNHALAQESLDLDSCLQFLMDLYTAWLQPNEIPLCLLTETVKSLVCISELFVRMNQFYWMLKTFLNISKNHPLEDEILQQYLVFGVCKATAVLAPLDTETLEKVKRFLDSSFNSSFMPVKIAVLHGTLYLMQAATLANCEETMKIIKPAAVDYVQNNVVLQDSSRVLNRNEEHQGILWALVFFMLEHIDDSPLDTESPAVLEVAFSLITTQNLSPALHKTILHGLERLVATKSMNGKLLEKIVKVAIDRLKQISPILSLPALQLLLTCMYVEAAEKFNQPLAEEPLPDIEPETLVRSIERTSAIFDRVKKGLSMEVDTLCAVLSGVLSDFFLTSNILTKVVGEFLSPQQPHPGCMAAVVFKICEKSCNDSQLNLLQEWVLFSLPNFIQSLPTVMSTWFLSCLFISLSTNKWLRALFPHVQSRIGKYEHEDERILCIAASDFYHQLFNEAQKQTFIQIFENAAKQPGTPFSDILASF